MTPEQHQKHVRSVAEQMEAKCKSICQSDAKQDQPVTVKVYRSTPEGINLIATHKDVQGAVDEHFSGEGALAIVNQSGKTVARYRPLRSVSYTIEEQEGDTQQAYAVASLHFSLTSDGVDVEQRLEDDLLLMTIKLAQPPKNADGQEIDEDSDEFLAYITSPHENLIREHVDVYGHLHDRDLIETNQWLSHGQDFLSHFVKVSDQYGHDHYYQVFMAPIPGRDGDQEVREVRLVCGPDFVDYHEGICRPMIEHLKKLQASKDTPKKKGDTSRAAPITRGAV